MAFRLSGTTNVVLISRRLQWNHLQGEYLEEVYEGTQTAINGLRLANLSNPAISDILSDNEGPKWRAVIRYLSNENVLEEGAVFETRLAKNRITKDLWEHPEFRDIDVADKDAIRSAVDDNHELFVSYPPGSRFLKIYALLKKGVTSYVVFQPVLTVVHTAPYGFQWDVNYLHVGKIISTAAIAAISQPAANLINSLPSYLTDNDDLIAGWLKHPPEVSTSGNSKQSVIYEFEYGHWSSDIYEVAP